MQYSSLIVGLLDVYSFILISWITLNWLVRFGVVNLDSDNMAKIAYALHRLTDPPLKLIRKCIPPFNGFDIAIVVLTVAVYVIKYTIIYRYN